MLAGKTNKVHSVSGSQTKTAQQQCQQPDLQHLSLVIEQFSSQLNLMLSQQQLQQEKHSDTNVGGDAMNDKQEHPSYFQQQQQIHCPVNASRFAPLAYSHSNFCNNNTLGSCLKTNNQHHCRSTYLSPSLSSLLPSQHHHTSNCLHQNYPHHPQHLVAYGYDSIPPTCALSMLCYCHLAPHQCTTTKCAIPPPPMNDTSPPSTPTGTTAFERCQRQHYHSNNIPTTTMRNSLEPSTTGAPCSPHTTTHQRFKSRTDPLPPIPNDDNDKVMAVNDLQTVPDLQSSPCSTVSSPKPQAENSSHQEQHGQISWTDIYRQDIMANQDTLVSSYSNGSSSSKKARSNRSAHFRGWWSHGKSKWKQLRRKSVSPLFVPG